MEPYEITPTWIASKEVTDDPAGESGRIALG